MRRPKKEPDFILPEEENAFRVEAWLRKNDILIELSSVDGGYRSADSSYLPFIKYEAHSYTDIMKWGQKFRNAVETALIEKRLLL